MKILIIEDNIDHAFLIEETLLDIDNFSIDTSLVSTLTEGLHRLKTEYFDICLCDLSLSDATIDQTVEALSSDSFSLPIVVLTSLSNNDIAETLLNAGIQDYLSKEDLSPELLYRSCRYAIERWKYQQKINAYNQDMITFCSSLSHDFNGHINQIKSISTMLKDDLNQTCDLTTDNLELFDHITTSTKNISLLVNDLYHYLSVNLSSIQLNAINLNQIISEVIASLTSTTNTPFNIKINNTLPIVLGQASLLHILFINLITNAIKYNQGTPEISITSEDKGNKVAISIQDNGIGFNQKHADRIFLPFKRLVSKSQFVGSGLGLSIVKRIINHLDGEIHVQSEEGIGTRFTVTLNKQ